VNQSLDSRIAMDPPRTTPTAEPSAPHVRGDFMRSVAPATAQALLLPELSSSAQDSADFHAELRQRCLPILAWGAAVFNTLYLAWSGFDYVAAPNHFRYFLSLRLIATTFNTLLVIAVHQKHLQRYVWEAYWLWAFTKGAFVALMLAVVDESSYMAYLVGFTLIIYGAGILSSWPPSWSVSLVVPMVAMPFLRLVSTSSLLSFEIVSAAFIVLSSTAISLIIAFFKYSLAKRDFLTRRALSDLALREHDARVDLDRAGTALRAALAQLKEVDRLKSHFFANISHELRTPLTLILTPLENMREELGTGASSRNLDVVRRNAERLLRLIDDLLELSRLDAGGLRLSVSEVDLRVLAGTVYENALAAANSRKVRFEFQSDAQVQRVHGDAHRLEIVLTNLVSNALKFTPASGSVIVKVRNLSDGVQVDVSDTGPGITEDDMPHVFERFFQVSGAERRKNQGGVGIGLALAKELVELHGGRLWVRSAVGRGSVFSVFFPYGREHIRPEVIERRSRQRGGDTPATFDSRITNLGTLPSESTQASPASYVTEAPVLMRGKRRARIVLAEDQDELRTFIAELLRSDYELFLAEDGARALELIRKERPDLVISDVMMPELSGAQLCSTIKKDPQLANTPVILLTARVGAEATLEGYSHGADDFVPKPFHPRVLLARVRAQLMLRKMALDLAEREKLAAVGTLSAGVLHEVRNPVNAILNAARVLAEAPNDGETTRRLLSVVSDCAGRIHQLTQSLDAHARPADGGTDGICDVAEGLDATLALISHRLHGVKVVRSYAPKVLARAPSGPLNQIFLNLLDNALLAGAKALHIAIVDDDTRVHVTIEDDGAGVPEELRERIFDAFVSGSIKGSGLGLYLSRCIAEQYGGSLALADGRREAGAAFVVSMPRGDGT
jgi:signal transduction histidine kinase